MDLVLREPHAQPAPGSTEPGSGGGATPAHSASLNRSLRTVARVRRTSSSIASPTWLQSRSLVASADALSTQAWSEREARTSEARSGSAGVPGHTDRSRERDDHRGALRHPVASSAASLRVLATDGRVCVHPCQDARVPARRPDEVER